MKPAERREWSEQRERNDHSDAKPRRGIYIKSARIPNCLCPCMPRPVPAFVFGFAPWIGIIISGFCLIF